MEESGRSSVLSYVIGRSWLSLSGLVLVGASLFAFILLFCLDLGAHHSNPYLGVLAYLVAPGFTAIGVGMIVLGIVIQRWQMRRTGTAGDKVPFLMIDTSRPGHRRKLTLFVVGTVVTLLVTALGSYQSYHFSESTGFCGQACHGVMKPEYVTYQHSPHARVSCSECHIGPGAEWYVKAKISGLYQVYATLFDFVQGYAFDPEHEDYLVHITTGTHVAQICWFLLTEARWLPGRLIQTSPPRKQRAGDPGSYAIIDLDLARYDRIAQRFTALSADTAAFLKSGIATRSPAFNRMIEEIERVAGKSKAPMLLMGPTGAGKSQLAKRVFELKKLKHQLPGRFVEVNCATLRGDGAMSALFGHVKGAYTGAGRAVRCRRSRSSSRICAASRVGLASASVSSVSGSAWRRLVSWRSTSVSCVAASHCCASQPASGCTRRWAAKTSMAASSARCSSSSPCSKRRGSSNQGCGSGVSP